MPPQAPDHTQTLAQMIRAKYPGAYDDFTDEALEAAILAKHPQYKDLPRSSAAERRAKTKIGGSGYAGDAGTTYGDIETPGKQLLGNLALDLTLGYAGGGLLSGTARHMGGRLMREGAKRMPTFAKSAAEIPAEVSALLDEFGKPIVKAGQKFTDITIGPASKQVKAALPIKAMLKAATGNVPGAIVDAITAAPIAGSKLVRAGSALAEHGKTAGRGLQALITSLLFGSDIADAK